MALVDSTVSYFSDLFLVNQGLLGLEKLEFYGNIMGANADEPLFLTLCNVYATIATVAVSLFLQCLCSASKPLL